MSLRWVPVTTDQGLGPDVRAIGLDAIPFADVEPDDAARLLIHLGEIPEISPDLAPTDLLSSLDDLQNSQAVRFGDFLDQGKFAVTPLIPKEAIADPKAVTGVGAFADALKVDQPDNDRCAAGIIDISIAFVSSSFRYKDNHGYERSRFHMLWLQDRVFRPGAQPPGFSGIQLPFGTLLLKRDIDLLISLHSRGGRVDEHAIYALFQKPNDGLRDLWSMRGGHGTSVLDLMTGSDDATEDGYQPIYAVELPTRIVADTSGDQMFTAMTAGLIVILGTRLLEGINSLAFPMKGVVINTSISFTGGPQDGSYEMAAFIDALLGLYSVFMPVKLCVPRGNHLQDMMHARLPARQGGELIWSLPPEDTTKSEMEIWRYDGNGNEVPSTDDLEFAVGPTGYDPVYVSPGDFPPPLAGHATALVTDQGRPLAYLTNDGRRLLLTALPTRPRGGGPSSPSGLWTIVIKDPSSETVLCWIKRDDTLRGLRAAGLQSRFFSESYRKRAANGDWDKQPTPGDGVRRDGTISVLATSQNQSGAWRIVSGWEGSVDGPTSYRFSGQSLDTFTPPTPYHPDFYPRAEVTRSLGGPLTRGREGRTILRGSGTSLATAIAARRESETQCQMPHQPDADLGHRNRIAQAYRY